MKQNFFFQNKRQDWKQYVLPAGKSILNGDLVEQVCNQKNKTSLSILNEQNVFLATSKHNSFSDFWLPLLASAGANVRRLGGKRS